MRNRYLPFIFVLLLRAAPLAAQAPPAFTGMVKDGAGKPVAAASVTVVRPGGAGIFFTKTAADGRFECRLPEWADSCSVKVAALGFATAVVPAPSPAFPLEITLCPTPVALPEVTVKSNAPIRRSKDTLQYNVSAFRDKNDRVVADLVGRLPGLQVDEQGAISYNGKNISTVYIDGDDLLGGRYRIATNNVPVGAVEQIQVIERDQPVKALEGFVPADNVSLNLKLAADARATIINTGHAGVGNNVYSGELNNIIFRQQIKSINNLKANNTGENLALENADLRVAVNGQALPVHQPYLSMASNPQPSVDEKYYLRNNDFAGNINTLFSLRTGWKLRLNVSSPQLKQANRYTNRLRYLLPDGDTLAYDETQHHVFRQRNLQGQVQLEKNGRSAFVRSVTKAEAPWSTGAGYTTQHGQTLQQQLPLHQATFSNDTRLIKALGNKNLLQYQSAMQYYSVSERLQVSPGIFPEIIGDSAGYSLLKQAVRTRDFYLHQSVSYKTKLQRFVLTVSAGGKYEKKLLKSDLVKAGEQGKETTLGAPFVNDAAFSQTGLYAQGAVLYQFPKGHVSLEVAPTHHFIRHPGGELPALRSGKYFTTNPVLEIRKQVGKFGELNARYAQETAFGQLQDVYTGTILANYRQFSFNDVPLPVTKLLTGLVRYAYRHPLKMLFYHVSLSAGNSSQNYIRTFVVDRDMTKSITVDFKNVTRQYAANGSLSKYLFAVSTQFSGAVNAGLQEGNTLFNGSVVPFSVYTLRGNATLRRKLGAAATLAVTGEEGISHYRQENGSGGASRNVTRSQKVRVEWQHQPHEKISWKVMYHFISYRQFPQPAIRNHFLECNVRIAPFGTKSYFELLGTNLVNRSFYRQITANAYQVSELRLPLRERMLMLKYFFTF